MNKPVVLPSEIAQQLAVYIEQHWYEFTTLSWDSRENIDCEKLAKTIQEFYDSIP